MGPHVTLSSPSSYSLSTQVAAIGMHGGAAAARGGSGRQVGSTSTGGSRERQGRWWEARQAKRWQACAVAVGDRLGWGLGKIEMKGYVV